MLLAEIERDEEHGKQQQCAHNSYSDESFDSDAAERERKE